MRQSKCTDFLAQVIWSPPITEPYASSCGCAEIAFDFERVIKVACKGESIVGQKLDLIVDSRVVVEVKAVSQLEEIHGSQLVSYLRSTGLRAGLLINFNAVVLKAGIRRIVR